MGWNGGWISYISYRTKGQVSFFLTDVDSMDAYMYMCVRSMMGSTRPDWTEVDQSAGRRSNRVRVRAIDYFPLSLSLPLQLPFSPLHATVADGGIQWQPVADLRGSRPWSNDSHSRVLIGKNHLLQRNIGCTLDATDVVHVEMCVVLHPQGRLPRGFVLDLSPPSPSWAQRINGCDR